MGEERTFKDQAARCRRLAGSINDWPARTLLLQMAEEFEEKARSAAEGAAEAPETGLDAAAS